MAVRLRRVPIGVGGAVEVMQRGGRSQSHFRDCVLTPSDHAELGRHLHHLNFSLRIASARLHEEFRGRFTVRSAGGAP